MDFSWSPEQLALRASVVQFAREQLNEDVVARDHAAEFPRELWRRAGDFGIPGLAVPHAYGGTEHDALSVVLALEGLGYGCRDNGLIFALNAHMWAVQAPLVRFASDAQKTLYLPRLASGEAIGAHGMSEPDSGSDAFAMATRYSRVDGGFVLDGRKTFVSNAPVADVFLVFASRAGSRGFLGISAFIVDRGTPGFSVTPQMHKMGLRTAPMADLVFDGCVVGPDQLVGAEGNGATIFRYAMGWERCCILASYIGTMERQLELCIEYARTRQQFGKPIGKFQAVSGKIVDMRLRLDTARLLLYRAAWLRSRGEEATAEVALAKLHLSESALHSALHAVQVHGGYGYTTELELERELRDAVGSSIYSGTSEIQREIVARALGL